MHVWLVLLKCLKCCTVTHYTHSRLLFHTLHITNESLQQLIIGEMPTCLHSSPGHTNKHTAQFMEIGFGSLDEVVLTEHFLQNISNKCVFSCLDFNVPGVEFYGN